MKIAVLGHSGIGKSTLAKWIGKFYSLPVLYLDTVYFTSGWQERNPEEAKEIVTTFMAHEDWVIDGNFSGLHLTERLEQADCIICLCFSRWNCLYRAYKRYFKYRNKSRESMAEGCKEKLDWEFVWWILYKGRDRGKQEFYHNVATKYKDKTVVLKNQKQINAWLYSLEKKRKEKNMET